MFLLSFPNSMITHDKRKDRTNIGKYFADSPVFSSVIDSIITK